LVVGARGPWEDGMNEKARRTVQVSIGPHTVRYGWETLRIHYDPEDERQAAQVEAVLTALAKARRAAGEHQGPADIAAYAS
jgi:hypothetical protein